MSPSPAGDIIDDDDWDRSIEVTVEALFGRADATPGQNRVDFELFTHAQPQEVAASLPNSREELELSLCSLRIHQLVEALLERRRQGGLQKRSGSSGSRKCRWSRIAGRQNRSSC